MSKFSTADRFGKLLWRLTESYLKHRYWVFGAKD
jgi:hypothetical protein